MPIKLVSIFIFLFIILLPFLFIAADTALEEELTTVPFDPHDTFSGWADFGVLYTLSSQSASPLVMAIRVVNIALIFLGALSSAMILYAGFLWFLARDNEEQVKKAQDIIKGAVIGLALVLLSYGIAYTIYYVFAYVT